MRPTLEGEIPTASAIMARLQWVALGGLSCTVLAMTFTHVRLERLNAGAPFLKVHELGALDAVIGSVVPGSARLQNGRGIALVRVSGRDDVEPIWRDIQAGHIRAVSIGYQVHRFEVSKPDGGRELWRAVDWTPFEVSAVPVADSALITQAIDGTPCELVFAWSLGANASFTFTAHAVYLPRPRIEIPGPQGIQATFDWQAAKAVSPVVADPRPLPSPAGRTVDHRTDGLGPC